MNIQDKVALITDGRFSGGSHGFIIGHVSPEAYLGGPISEVDNGDLITIDASKNVITWSSTMGTTSKDMKTKKKIFLKKK